jgi:hypothetical protein
MKLDMISTPETHPNLAGQPGCVQLLTLPAELRLQILSFALSLDCGDQGIASFDIARRFRKPVSQGTTNISVLLVCRQIYHEARLLPFQNTEFAFQRWYGSSTAECLQFFQKLQPWQIGTLRSLKLDVTEADLGGLSRVDEVCAWLFPNSIDGLEGPRVPELQHLSLHVSRAGLWPDPADVEALFNLGSKWSVQGVLRLTSLRTLHITFVASVELPAQTAKAFEEQLWDQMPWCNKVSVMFKQVKTPRQKFEEFSRAMGWGPEGPGTL